MNAPDLRHPILVHEYEYNPFLAFDPSFQALRDYEAKHGIVNISEWSYPEIYAFTSQLKLEADYGVLSLLNGKLPQASASALLQSLDDVSKTTGLSPAELLLSWAYDCLGGLVVSSSSREDRLAGMAKLFLRTDVQCLPDSVYAQIGQAATKDGFEGKAFYKHPHMEGPAVA